MTNFHVLMLSASRAGESGFLEHAQSMICEHLQGINHAVFVPYAGVTVSHDDYTQKVQNALPALDITGIHTAKDKITALAQAEAILVGGGNTFVLLNSLYELGLLDLMKTRLASGVPYIGWSAGSNICAATIKTTNDMPIVEPPSFDALGVLPCQLNPHYTDYVAPGHNGETRDQRLQEFTTVHPHMPILGIQEGSALRYSGQTLDLLGDLPAYLFLGTDKTLIEPHSDLTHMVR